MEKELTKNNSKEIVPQENYEIVSDEEIKEVIFKVYDELEENRQESLDMYYIFKDMIVNSGDFDSSGVVKEQVVQLLKNAQEASNSKSKIALELLKSKNKNTSIQNTEINQNNFNIGMDRRSMIEAIEKIAKDKEEKIEEKEEGIIVDIELDKLEEKEKEIINNNDINFKIDSGDF